MPTSRDVYNEEKRLVGQWYEVGRKDPRNGIRELRTRVLGDVIRNSKTGEILNPPAMPSGNEEDVAFAKWLAQEKIEDIDVLMALERAGGEPYVLVSGDDLSGASSDYDRQGRPAVGFTLNTAGSSRMFQLTAANGPDGNFHRRMAIILDERVLSAPQLNSAISDRGIIEGNFTREEVEFIVQILRAGKLPAALSKQPISESRIG
jgi:SecD/SecF fusion protein